MTEPSVSQPVSQPKTIASQWTGWHTVGLLIIIVLMVLVGLLMPSRDRLWTYVVNLILLAAFTAAPSKSMTFPRWIPAWWRCWALATAATWSTRPSRTAGRHESSMHTSDAKFF